MGSCPLRAGSCRTLAGVSATPPPSADGGDGYVPQQKTFRIILAFLAAVAVLIIVFQPRTSDDDGGGTEERPRDRIRALQTVLKSQGIDPQLAGYGIAWCTHRDMNTLMEDVGGRRVAQAVAEGAAATVCRD